MTGGSASARPRLTTADSDDWCVAVPREHSASAHSDVQVTFFGALVDRVALARDAGVDGLPADADLVAASFARWGSAAFSRLRGRFALVLTDVNACRTYIVRDPLGTFPLFYAETPSGVVVASTPRRLVRQPGVNGALNTTALAELLCRRWPAADETFFASVKRLPPGRLLVVTRAGVRVERYWDPAPIGEPVRWLQADELDRFDSLLEQAVDRCVSSAHAGVFLSGGLDSISVAAVAADQCSSRSRPAPMALSLGFPDPECDERLRQVVVAKTLGLPIQLVSFDDAVGARGLLAQSLELGATLASPLMNTWGPAYISLARRGRAHGVQTILTGMGGDEWLTVSPLVTADLMARGEWRAVAAYLGTLMRSHALPRVQILRNVLWTYGLRPLAGRTLSRLAPAAWDARRARRRVRDDPDWVAPDPTLRAALRARAPRHLGPADPSDGFYLHELRASLDGPLVSWELEEQYEFGRAAGVVFAHPYWDVDLVDALLRTPPALLSRDGRSKGLVRAAVAHRFPTIGLDRQRKVSGTTFYRAILRREAAAALDAVGPCPVLEALGVVDGRRSRSALDEARAGSILAWSSVWSLANLESWARANVQ
jgi:asparagine synthase (glutamine-hydrolysing)